MVNEELTPGGTPLSVLNLSKRARTCLRREGIATVETLCELSDQHLLSIPNLGQGTLEDIRTKIAHWLESSDPDETLNNQVQSMYVSGVDDVLSIDALELSRRAMSCLRKAGISSVGELKGTSEDSLLNIPGFGMNCLREVAKKIREWDGGKRTDTALSIMKNVRPDLALLSACQAISARDIEIFERRSGFVNGEPQTLELIAQSMSMTRERIRQIDKKTRAAFGNIVEIVRTNFLRSSTNVLRLEFGLAREFNSWDDLCTHLAASAFSDNLPLELVGSNVAIDIALITYGPFDVVQLKSRREDSPTLYSNRFAADEASASIRSHPKVLSSGFFMSVDDADEVLLHLRSSLHQLSIGECEEYIEQLAKVKRINDDLYSCKAFSLADLIYFVMSQSGSPMTVDEISAAIDGYRKKNYIQNVVSADARFQRSGIKEYALRTWNLQEYDGIFHEILKCIARDGGSTSLQLLCDEMNEKFGVSKSSVSIYCNTQKFVIQGDSVRLRRDDEFVEVYADITGRSNFWWTNAGRTLRMRVICTQDVLRGSGSQIAAVEAAALGVQWSGRRKFHSYIYGSIEVVWSESQVNPTISSVRGIAESLQVGPQDEFFLDFDVENESFDAVLLNTMDSEETL